MAYLTVDEKGNEEIWNDKPERTYLYYERYGLWSAHDCEGQSILMPKGSIQKLIGKSLTWNDEPFELK